MGYFIKHGFGFGFDFGFGLILNRVRDVHRIKVRAAQRTGLCARCRPEFVRSDRDRWDAQILQVRRVVQTARRTRSSIG